jgi:hypothetical protein
MALNRHLRDPKVLRCVFECLRKELVAKILAEGLNGAQKLGCKCTLQLLSYCGGIRNREPAVSPFTA